MNGYSFSNIQEILSKRRPYGHHRKFYEAFYACGWKGRPGKSELASLYFLHTSQAPDGRWYSESGTRDGDLLTTALSFLAFLGNGQTVKYGEYRKTMEKALNFLEKSQDVNGCYSDDTVVQAACTMAISELFAIERNKRAKPLAERAAENLDKRILADGGLPARKGEIESDLIATCWSVLSLKAATMGCVGGGDFRNNKYRKLLYTHLHKYIKNTLAEKKDKDSYARLAIAAIFCGINRDDKLLDRAWKALQENLPSWEKERDAEYLYFGTYACFQKGGKIWDLWNKNLKDTLVERQNNNEFHEGSWKPVFGENSILHGRAYTTAINTLSLEIYYRYAREQRKGE